MPNEYKVCPSCGDEYTAVPERCADCGVPLVFAHEIEPEIPESEFPQTSELECIRVGPMPWSQALSGALTEAEIAHRVERDTRSVEEGGVDPRHFDGADLFGVWVRASDLDAANDADKIVFAHVDGQSEEAPDADSDEQCPACQATLPIEALECPDCGLPFG
jgi:rRNA maturation endonuclease Nob1